MKITGLDPTPLGTDLRMKGEMRLQESNKNTAAPDLEELQYVVHELHVYEAELQIQNEELLASRAIIEESQSRYFRQFDLAPVGLVRIDHRGMIREVNILGAQMLAISRAQLQLVKRPFLAHIAPGWQVAFQQHLENALSSGKMEMCELSLRTAAGVESFVRIQTIRSRGKAVANELYLTITDLTERRRMECELTEQKQVAESACLAKERLIAMVSHKLGAPLVPVFSLLRWLESAPNRSPEEGKAFITMRRHLELEKRLVDDLLDVTLIASGKLVLNRSVCDVHQCLQASIEVCQPDFQAKQILLDVQLGASRHFANADRCRLQQAFSNLLANAVKFTPEGGRVTVRTSDAPSGSLAVEVCDTGIGIEKSALGRIFDPFEQLDSSVTRRLGGLGLGLAIAQSLTEAHSGTLKAVSAGVGKGAIFVLELPAVDEWIGEMSAENAEASPPIRREGLRLLLVEDHDDVRNVLRRVLGRRGYEVEAAANAANAKALCIMQHFDLVVSDLGLPDSGGHELLKELFRDHRLRGIAISDFDSEAELSHDEAPEYLERLFKPLDISELDSAIQRVAWLEHVSQGLPPTISVPREAGSSSPDFVEQHFVSTYRFAFCLSLSHEIAGELTEAVFSEAHRTQGDTVAHRIFKRDILASVYREWTGRPDPLRRPDKVEMQAITDRMLLWATPGAEFDQTTVLGAIHSIPEELCPVLSLSYFEHCTDLEIAWILRLPAEIVTSRLAAAHALLREGMN